VRIDDLQTALEQLSSERPQRLEGDAAVKVAVGASRPHCPMVLAGFDPRSERLAGQRSGCSRSRRSAGVELRSPSGLAPLDACIGVTLQLPAIHKPSTYVHEGRNVVSLIV